MTYLFNSRDPRMPELTDSTMPYGKTSKAQSAISTAMGCCYDSKIASQDVKSPQSGAGGAAWGSFKIKTAPKSQSWLSFDGGSGGRRGRNLKKFFKAPAGGVERRSIAMSLSPN